MVRVGASTEGSRMPSGGREDCWVGRGGEGSAGTWWRWGGVAHRDSEVQQLCPHCF